MVIQKYDGETQEQLIYRVCSLKEKIGTWQDVADTLNELLDQDFSESRYRKMFQNFEKLMDANTEKFESLKDYEEEINNLKDELYKERVKLSDANREKNKYLREQSRTETIIEEMIYAIEHMKPFNYRKCDYSYGTNLEASILVSDLHYGIEIDNIKNFYNANICEERLNELADKTIHLCKMHKVDKLNVCILGDDISGLIHFGTISENNRDVITQCIEVSELLCNFVMKLRESIPNIKVYTTYGNHGRSWQNKSNGSNKENYERIVSEFIKTRLKPYQIKVVDSGWEDFIVAYIANKTIVMTHGDKDSFSMASGNFTKLLKQPIDEIYMAHYHSHKEMDDCGTQVVVNGSLVSTDDYAMTLRKHTEPVQLLRIYGEDVCCYRLVLK